MNDELTDIEKMSYEESLTRLKDITNRLESEQLPLEQMLDLYSQGQILVNRCNQLLDEAELKVKTLNAGKSFSPAES